MKKQTALLPSPVGSWLGLSLAALSRGLLSSELIDSQPLRLLIANKCEASPASLPGFLRGVNQAAQTSQAETPGQARSCAAQGSAVPERSSYSGGSQLWEGVKQTPPTMVAGCCSAPHFPPPKKQSNSNTRELKIHPGLSGALPAPASLG